MRLGFRTRLLALSLSLIGVGSLAASALLSHHLQGVLLGQLRADLRSRARTAARQSLGLVELTVREAGLLAQQLEARVVLGDETGAALADSAAGSMTRPAGAALAPEVRAALSLGTGEALREGMMHVAAVERDGTRLRVATVSRPLDEVVRAVGHLRWLVALCAFSAAATAFLLTSLVARALSRAVATVAAAARRMAAGERGSFPQPQGAEALTDLGRAVNELAASLFSALRALRGERDRLEGVLEALQEGVLVLDAEGRIERLNPALRELLLLSGEARGRPPLEVIRDAELQALLERAGASEEPCAAEVELGGLKPRRVQVRAARLPGEPGGVLAAFVDVTNVRRLEVLRRDFVANVSHELRTPIASLRSAAETLRGALAADPAAAERFLGILERNAERVQQLIEDLLDLARLESRELKLACAPVELAGTAQAVLGLTAESAAKKRIQLSCEVPAGLRAWADRRALEQAIANLLDNAVRHCPEQTRVSVRARERNTAVELEVCDSGPGIEPRHLPRLFERFYRVDAARSRELGGTGLGLSIVKHLVEAMGGAVSVESVAGQGSTFRIALRPCADPDTGDPAARSRD